jgi:hypothetical protein
VVREQRMWIAAGSCGGTRVHDDTAHQCPFPNVVQHAVYEHHRPLAFTADNGRGSVPIRVAEPGRRRFEAVRLEQFEPMVLERKTARVTIHFRCPCAGQRHVGRVRQTVGTHIAFSCAPGLGWQLHEGPVGRHEPSGAHVLPQESGALRSDPRRRGTLGHARRAHPPAANPARPRTPSLVASRSWTKSRSRASPARRRRSRK